jgi:hypothetical protein
VVGYDSWSAAGMKGEWALATDYQLLLIGLKLGKWIEIGFLYFF